MVIFGNSKRAFFGKTILLIVVVVLMAAFIVNADQDWGYTPYGTVYYYGHNYRMNVSYPAGTYYSPYSYSYQYAYPYGTYHPWQYQRPDRGVPAYESPYYTRPAVSYPLYSTPLIPRGNVGQLCGVIGIQAYGCAFGLECDYTKTGIAGVGMCIKPIYLTTYPYQLGPSTVNPYYYI